MAKLSESKKVELLESMVLENDINGVKTFLAEQGPIEFTAKALGLACRYSGADMVLALIDGGASFQFDFTPAMKRKYDCKIALNNTTDKPIDFSQYIFPQVGVGNYSNTILSDSQRVEVLDVLIDKKAADLQEMLYYSILKNDVVIKEELLKHGINELSMYRANSISGKISPNTMNMKDQTERYQFQCALHDYKNDELKTVLTGFLSCMTIDRFILFPSDYYDYGSSYSKRDKFVSKFCSEELFDLFVEKTNMVEKVKKSDLLYALIDQNNPSGMKYALAEKWISKPKEIDDLLKYAQKKKGIKAELKGYLMDEKNQSGKKESVDDSFSLSKDPISSTELKKLWGTKKLEDGSLMITSYKGEDINVIIPGTFGKASVTAIDPETFSPEAPRISKEQIDIRKKIESIEFPGSIREIPKRIFIEGFSYAKRPNLKRVILNEGIEKICKEAFYGCSEIEEIIIPESVKEIGPNAFEYCSSLKRVTLPSEIDKLEYGLFAHTGLESFEIRDQYSCIGSHLFSECEKLRNVKLSACMKEIPNGMFAFCKSLLELEIPDGIVKIDDYAFSGSAIKKCVIPNSVKEIGERAFNNCKDLTDIIIPIDVSIGDAAFTGCNGLADENGSIVINECLYGLSKENEGWEDLSSEQLIKPLILKKNIKKVAVPFDCLPEIVCRECTDSGEIISIDSVSVGDEITFGRFPNNDDFIMHPLKWRVIAKENGKALLITVDDIISLDRNVKQTGVWAKSNARKMLNDGFLNTAFGEVERSQIATVTLSTAPNKKCKVDGGPNTKDRVFLLSMEEVEKYMPSVEDRKSKATEYAQKQRQERRNIGYWQLRTPGEGMNGSVAVEDYSGEFSAMTGNHVGYSYIRPAIWIQDVK